MPRLLHHISARYLIEKREWIFGRTRVDYRTHNTREWIISHFWPRCRPKVGENPLSMESLVSWEIALAGACRLLERDAGGEDVGVVFHWHAESIVCLELV